MSRTKPDKRITDRLRTSFMAFVEQDPEYLELVAAGRGWTKAIAKKIGVPPTIVSHLANGAHRDYSLSTLLKLQRYMRSPLDAILGLSAAGDRDVLSRLERVEAALAATKSAADDSADEAAPPSVTGTYAV